MKEISRIIVSERQEDINERVKEIYELTNNRLDRIKEVKEIFDNEMICPYCFQEINDD